MIVESTAARRAPANNTRVREAANAPPSQNTRSANKSRGVEQLANAIKIFKQQQLTQGKCPMEQLKLKEMVNAVLDVETAGKMLEYRHLRQNTKYKVSRK